MDQQTDSKIVQEQLLEPTDADLQEIKVTIEEPEVFKGKSRIDTLSGQERYMIPFNHPILPHEEVIDLVHKMRTGDEQARERIILHNLRFVLLIARHFKNRGLDDQDLYQEGVVGLMKGIERFDPARGCRLTTYVSWWIQQSIRYAISQTGSEIRVPTYMSDRRKKVIKSAASLQAQLGRRPTIEEIQKETGLSFSEVTDVFEHTTARVTLSIHDTIEYGDGTTEHGEHIADPQALSPADLLELKDALEGLDEKIRTLFTILKEMDFSERDIEMFKIYYAVTESPVQISETLKMTGNKFNITRERVRQILAKMWVKLERRNPDWLFVLRALEIRANKVQPTYAPKFKRFGNQRKKVLRGINFDNHFRAAPSFVKWQLNQNRKNNQDQVCDLVARAYEVPFESIVCTKSQKSETRWARSVSMYLMREVLRLNETVISTYFESVSRADVQNMCAQVETVIKQNSFVSEDVLKIKNHLSQVMKLQ